jgi:hypothetical protein
MIFVLCLIMSLSNINNSLRNKDTSQNVKTQLIYSIIPNQFNYITTIKFRSPNNYD